MDEDLAIQLPLAKEGLELMGIDQVETQVMRQMIC